MFGKYTKAITALVTPLVGAVTAIVVSPAPGITSSEWLFVGVSVLTGLGVLGVTNTPAAPAAPDVPPAV